MLLYFIQISLYFTFSFVILPLNSYIAIRTIMAIFLTFIILYSLLHPLQTRGELKPILTDFGQETGYTQITSLWLD